MNNKLKNIIIKETATIKEAMSNLQKSSKKILCVLNNKKSLVGVLNDGDIRRSILKNLSYETKVKNIMIDINNLISSWINQNPGQWFWHHRRWKV